MKVAIVNNHQERSIEVVKKLKQLLAACHIKLDQLRPDVVISVGGDGTLLKGFHQYTSQVDHVQFIGIHTGHLGFYTDWRDYQIEELVNNLVEAKPEYVSYPLLDLEVERASGMDHFLALNEATIKRVSQTLKGDIAIKDEFFESFRGDGLCVSTPTGSTAYSKSLGGAVLHPRLEALQLTEIASINNRVFRTLSSPVVIAPNEWITITPEHRKDYILTIDSRELVDQDVRQLRFKIAKEKIHFAKYQHTHFWSRVEDAFIGRKSEN